MPVIQSKANSPEFESNYEKIFGKKNDIEGLMEVKKLAETVQPIVLSDHPLLLQWYELMQKVETLPAHIDQTALITDLGAWGEKLKNHLHKHNLIVKNEPIVP